MSRRSDAPRVRRRRCSETMLEEVVTSFADSMEWGPAPSSRGLKAVSRELAKAIVPT